MDKWWVGEKQDINVIGLKRRGEESYLNAATITGELRTLAGAVVSGSTFSLTYETGSNGNYSGVKPAAAAITAGVRYDLFILDSDADDPVNRSIRGLAEYRGKK